MVLNQVLLLFGFFILALDKCSRSYKIQFISDQFNNITLQAANQNQV